MMKGQLMFGVGEDEAMLARDPGAPEPKPDPIDQSAAIDQKVREAAEMRQILERAGYDPAGVERLQQDRIGPVELLDRLREADGLTRTHGIAKLKPSQRAPIDAPVKLDHLDDLQLLEIVLGAKAKPLLAAAGGDLVLLGQWSLPELENRGKLTGPQARRLLAALTAGKRAATRTTLDRTRVVSPAEVAKFIVGKIGTDRRREHFVELLLDVQNHVMRYIEVSEGSLSATLVHPREVFAQAITDRAHAIIVAHNHPSGAVQPSQEDVALTRRLVRAGDELGIRVLDSLVVNAQGDYFSLADAGMMRP